MGIIEKECKICGAFFKTTNPNRLCCDDCSTHYNERRREYEKAYRNTTNRPWEPKVIELTCYQCGKTYKTIPRLIISKDGNTFCTEQCRDRYKQSLATCAWCGKSMKDNGRYNPRNVYDQYCCQECEDKAKYQKALNEGLVRKCIRCGKIYIGKAKYFCGNECYRAAVKEGWRPEKTKVDEPKLITRVRECVVCKKSVTVHVTPEELQHMSFGWFCSEKCKDIYKAYRERKERS